MATRTLRVRTSTKGVPELARPVDTPVYLEGITEVSFVWKTGKRYGVKDPGVKLSVSAPDLEPAVACIGTNVTLGRRQGCLCAGCSGWPVVAGGTGALVACVCKVIG
jgi:hypothetical protein